MVNINVNICDGHSEISSRPTRRFTDVFNDELLRQVNKGVLCVLQGLLEAVIDAIGVGDLDGLVEVIGSLLQDVQRIRWRVKLQGQGWVTRGQQHLKLLNRKRGTCYLYMIDVSYLYGFFS